MTAAARRAAEAIRNAELQWGSYISVGKRAEMIDAEFAPLIEALEAWKTAFGHAYREWSANIGPQHGLLTAALARITGAPKEGA